MTGELNELENLTDLVSQQISEIVERNEPDDDAAAAEYLEIVAEDLRYYAQILRSEAAERLLEHARQR